MTSQARSADAHLEVGEVVGYLAGTLTSAEREWVEFHLADCADCTSEVVSAIGITARPSRSRGP